MASDPLDVVRRSHAALNAHDAAGAAECAAEDIEIVAPPGEMHGRDGVRVLAQTYMTAFPDNEWIVAHQVVAGDTVASEYRLEGTHAGALATPLGAIPPTGNRVTSRICDVSRVREGEIVSVHMYWDNLAFLRALLIPGPRRSIPHVSGGVSARVARARGGDSEAREVVGQVYEALNAHDAEASAKLVSEDVEILVPSGELRGRDAFRRFAWTYITAFPDNRWKITDQAVAGDTVVTEQLVEGTHNGPLVTQQREIPPTGRRVTTRVCDVSRVRNGELASIHLYWDDLAVMQALGVPPGD